MFNNLKTLHRLTIGSSEAIIHWYDIFWEWHLIKPMIVTYRLRYSFFLIQSFETLQESRCSCLGYLYLFSGFHWNITIQFDLRVRKPIFNKMAWKFETIQFYEWMIGDFVLLQIVCCNKKTKLYLAIDFQLTGKSDLTLRVHNQDQWITFGAIISSALCRKTK